MNAASTNNDPTLVELVAGVATEARSLISAHADQARAEMAREMHRAQFAALIFATGGTLAAIGVMFVLMAFVPLLVEHAGWPIWTATLVEGAIALLLGGGMLTAGYYKLQSVHPIPTKSLVSLHESLQWISNN